MDQKWLVSCFKVEFFDFLITWLILLNAWFFYYCGQEGENN